MTSTRFAAGLGVFFLLAACSRSDAGDAPLAPVAPPLPAPGFPRVVRCQNGDDVRVERPPQRIVPANAAAIDFVLALVPPERVAALSRVSIPYSAAARALASWPEDKKFDQFVVEVMVGHRADLIVANTWQDAQTIAVLRGAGIPVVIVPDIVAPQDLAATLRVLGAAIGAEAAAEQRITDLQERLASLQQRWRQPRVRVLSYANLGTGGTCAGAGTNHDVIFEIAGMTNVAKERGLSGHASIDNEWLLAANPDWILVGESSERPGTSAGAAYLRATKALAGLAAVQKDRIVMLDPHLYASTSITIVDAASRLLDEVASCDAAPK